MTTGVVITGAQKVAPFQLSIYSLSLPPLRPTLLYERLRQGDAARWRKPLVEMAVR
ncbi:hypothetical protein [uncultured Nostoc sp.]|uniref:hypothetical protein n=1 Tax=uncultured Nostoc sp. TaxID=340711 RepID=UPI0035C9FE76